MEIPKTSRREVIRQLSLAAAGLGLMSIASCGQNTTANNSDKKAKKISPFYLPPEAPLQPGPSGMDIRTLIHSSQTNMQFSCVETAVAPKRMGPEPHFHKELDEVMYVLNGTASVIVDGKVSEIEAGGWHIRPRMIEHTFWNASEEPLHFIDMYFNQNFEDFLEELFHKIFPEMVSKHLTPASPEIATQIEKLNKQFGITSFPEKRPELIAKYGLIG